MDLLVAYKHTHTTVRYADDRPNTSGRKIDEDHMLNEETERRGQARGTVTTQRIRVVVKLGFISQPSQLCNGVVHSPDRNVAAHITKYRTASLSFVSANRPQRQKEARNNV